MPSLLDPLAALPLVFVDVETTGASPAYGDRVIELGIHRIEPGGELSADFQELVDPRRRLGAGITALTGITPDMLEGRPTFAAFAPAALALMRGGVIVGHNVRFDLGFLRGEFQRSGIDLDAELRRTPVLDTVRIARKKFGRGGNGLQKLAARLGVPPTSAHRALADCHTTAAVFRHMLDAPAGLAMTLVDAFTLQGGPMFVAPPATERATALPLELEEALDGRTDVDLEYVDATGERTVRRVAPVEIRRVNGETILVAHCRLRDGTRTFKLDRVVRFKRLE